MFFNASEKVIDIHRNFEMETIDQTIANFSKIAPQ